MAGSVATIADEKINARAVSLPCSYRESGRPHAGIRKETFHLFLLMGQSNMAGYAALLPNDDNEMEGVYMLRDVKEQTGKYTWVPGKQPVHARLKTDRFCLAGPFAKSYLELYPQATVGLIPMAWGGAPIAKMSKGTPFYQEAIEKALWAKKQGKLKALLWHQGESDTVSPELADRYESRLLQFIRDIRADLNEPELLVIIGNLGEFYGTGPDHSAPPRVKQIEKVKRCLRTIPDKLPRTGFVESTGLGSCDQHQVHFDRESYVIFGKRYLDVYWNMVKNDGNSINRE